MAVTLQLDRERVLAHRLVVQDLTRPVGEAVACRLLGLGIQNTPPGSGLVALAARTMQAGRTVTELLDEGGPLAVVIASRGAPHVVSRSELPMLRAALFPLNELEAAEVDEVSNAMREIVNGKAISRPALSEALNDKVSDSLRAWCERCRSRHVREGLFRKASLQAGLELDPMASPTMFRPSVSPPSGGLSAALTPVSPPTGGLSAALTPVSPPSGVALPAVPDQEGAAVELARRYIHFTGVARPADLAAWLGYKPGEIRATWDLINEDLTRCDVAGKRRWALTSDVESSLSHAAGPGGATLLPPSDPYLLGDRPLLVPAREHRRQLWRPVASPGAILVNGEIAGTWRHRTSGGRLRVTLHPFHTLDAAVMRDLARAAEEIAALRDASEAEITLGVAE